MLIVGVMVNWTFFNWVLMKSKGVSEIGHEILTQKDSGPD